MIEILVALIIIAVIYLIAEHILPAPIPLLVALVLVVVFVLAPLLHAAH